MCHDDPGGTQGRQERTSSVFFKGVDHDIPQRVSSFLQRSRDPSQLKEPVLKVKPPQKKNTPCLL